MLVYVNMYTETERQSERNVNGTAEELCINSLRLGLG